MKYLDIDGSELKELYIDKNLCIEEIASIFKVPNHVISKTIKKNKIVKSRSLIQQSRVRRSPLYQENPEVIRHLYLDENVSLDVLKLKYQCSTKAIIKYMRKYKIEKPMDKRMKQRAETYKAHFGVDHPSKDSSIKEKIMSTQIKQGTFSRINSKEEDELAKILVDIFGESQVLRQYKTKEYPFPCDFYIVPLSLYIEYQGSHYHGRCIFDPNNPEHQDRLRQLKIKNQNRSNSIYKNMIKCWSIRDPLKRKTAKENNLNWIEFFKYKEAIEYFKKLEIDFKGKVK